MHKYIILLAVFVGLSPAAIADTVFLEELTWTEVRDKLAGGTTTIIIPTAGTEQNGPHMVLGKHKYRMNAGSARIARALGNALVAPVMTYVPEGSISPPSGHMRYPGTISLPQGVFKSVLEHAARSLKQHGFTDILMIGDSGGNQAGMKAVSEMLNNEWQAEKTRVHFISAWYTEKDADAWYAAQGIAPEVVGRHAGMGDTSALLAIAPEHVRTDKMELGKGMDVNGVDGDPTKATVEIGRKLMDFKFHASIKQIKELMGK